MHLSQMAFIAFFLAFGTLSALGLPPNQRPAANPLDAQLLEIMRERARLWQLPPSEGGTRQIDVSALVCPLVTEESLNELFQANGQDVDYVPDSGYPPGSKLWRVKGDVVSPLAVSKLGIWLGPGVRCEVQFRLQH